MHIVTGSDDNYVPGVMVLIASAAWHNPQARFTVLDMEISAANRDRIDRLGERLGVRIDRIEVAPGRFSHMKARRSHLSRGTYLRLTIPELIDDDRVVYMDSDMVVTDSLSIFDTVDLGDWPLAAVPCPTPEPRELETTGTSHGTYINGGLLVMNLPVWRRENLAGKCLDLLNDPSIERLAEDQWAVNVVCRGRIHLLPARFNLYATEAAYASTADIPQDPAVLHYVVNGKPWRGPVLFDAIWHFHAAKIADLMPPRPKPSLAMRVKLGLKQVELAQRRVSAAILGKRKYVERDALRRAANNGPVRRYIAAQRRQGRGAAQSAAAPKTTSAPASP